jgi:quinol monooxygenase YgiN
MTTMFARHKVNDYKNWKHVYDEIAPLRKKNGVTAASVYRDAKDPNIIMVTHHFKDMKAATAFSNSADLKAAMAKAGVNGQPEFWFGEDVENTKF